MNQDRILDLETRVSRLEQESKLSYRQELRLRNALQGDKTYYVGSTQGASPTTAVTFKDGILTSVVSTSPSISPSASPSISPSVSPS